LIEVYSFVEKDSGYHLKKKSIGDCIEVMKSYGHPINHD